MTLKEKFKLPIDANNNINDYVAKQCEQIAEEFAIEFLDWYMKIMFIMGSKYIGKKPKELLQIFKKEKGL